MFTGKRTGEHVSLKSIQAIIYLQSRALNGIVPLTPASGLSACLELWAKPGYSPLRRGGIALIGTRDAGGGVETADIPNLCFSTAAVIGDVAITVVLLLWVYSTCGSTRSFCLRFWCAPMHACLPSSLPLSPPHFLFFHNRF